MPISKPTKRDQRMKNPPTLKLTNRDLEVMKALYEYRVLSTHQVQELFFSSIVKARARLQLLYHHGFVDRKFSGVYFDKMNSPISYVLDRRGAETLYDTGILTKGWSVKSKQVGTFFLQHTLEINSVRIAITKACQQFGFELVEWRSETELKDGFDHVKVPQIEHPIAVLPDSYLVIKTPAGVTTHFFLEVDRSTETTEKFRRKLLAYQVYLSSPLAKKRFGTTKFRVLTTTKSTARLENLKRVAEKIEGKNRFWFTVLNQVTENSVLNIPIWHVAGRTENASLLY
jgi:hypothetical protein